MNDGIRPTVRIKVGLKLGKTRRPQVGQYLPDSLFYGISILACDVEFDTITG
jgi:hypothetical protein